MPWRYGNLACHSGLLLLTAATRTSLTPPQNDSCPTPQCAEGLPREQKGLAEVKVERSRRACTSPAACRTPLSCRPAHEGAPPTGQVLSPPVQPGSPGCLSWDPWLWLSPPPLSLTWEEASEGDLWILHFHQYCIRRTGSRASAPS